VLGAHEGNDEIRLLPAQAKEDGFRGALDCC
jgi:hypothetical protein